MNKIIFLTLFIGGNFHCFSQNCLSQDFARAYNNYCSEKSKWEQFYSFPEVQNDSLYVSRTEKLLNSMNVCLEKATTLLDCVVLSDIDRNWYSTDGPSENNAQYISLTKLQSTFHSGILRKSVLLLAIEDMNSEWKLKCIPTTASDFDWQISLKKPLNEYSNDKIALIIILVDGIDISPFSKKEIIESVKKLNASSCSYLKVVAENLFEYFGNM